MNAEATPGAGPVDEPVGPLPDPMRDYPDAGERTYTEAALLAFGRQERAAERERCIAWLMARRDAFCEEHGYIDPDTNALEFGRGPHSEAKAEYVGELEEIAEGLRSMRPNAGSEGREASRSADLLAGPMSTEGNNS